MIILRHDIDNPYTNNLLLRANLKLGFPAWQCLGYLSSAKRLFEFEHELGIRATWFFRAITRPPENFMEALVRNGHEIAFHADRIRDTASFLVDYGKSMDFYCLGWSKHGHKGLDTASSEGGEGEAWNFPLYVSRTIEFEMKYFSGNLPFNEQECSFKIGGVTVFPSVYSLSLGYMNKKYDADWLIKHANDMDIVLEVHPEDYLLFPDVVTRIFEKCKTFIPFKKYEFMVRSND